MSGHSTPKSGIGSSGAFGSSSAGPTGACWACAADAAVSPQAAAASSQPFLRPFAPDTIGFSLATAPERRQCRKAASADLVDGALRLLGGEGIDQPLDLSPM